jgi:hypothetical protein
MPLECSLILGIVESPALLFIALASHSLLYFCMKFSFDFSVSVRNVIGILVGNALTIKSDFGMTLNLLIHEHGTSFIF